MNAGYGRLTEEYREENNSDGEQDAVPCAHIVSGLVQRDHALRCEGGAVRRAAQSGLPS